MANEGTRDYEMVTILSPEATEEDVTGTMERLDHLISGGGGSVSQRDSWGVRRLAFPVKKFREGNFLLTRFTLAPDAVAEVNRGLAASEDIIRFLVTTV